MSLQQTLTGDTHLNQSITGCQGDLKSKKKNVKKEVQSSTSLVLGEKHSFKSSLLRSRVVLPGEGGLAR